MFCITINPRLYAVAAPRHTLAETTPKHGRHPFDNEAAIPETVSMIQDGFGAGFQASTVIGDPSAATDLFFLPIRLPLFKKRLDALFGVVRGA